MGISGAKSKIRKGGGRPEGWYRLHNTRWEERVSQSKGTEYIALITDLEDKSGEEREQMFFLGPIERYGEHVRVEDDGSLVPVDEDDPFQLPENSDVGRLFYTMSEHGVSDKIMDQVGDNPAALDGLVLYMEQIPVLDRDGEPKKNRAGYDITNTEVTKVGDDSDMGGKAKKKSKSKKKAAPVEEEDEYEDDEFEDEFEDEEWEDEEEEPAPKKKTRRKGKNR